MTTFNDLINPTKKDFEYAFPYGKHKGKRVIQVIEEDPTYIIWASENVTSFNPTKEVLNEARYACEES